MWGLHNTGQEHPVVGGGTTYGTEDADIDAPEAWDIHTGIQDIIVAVLDSGIDYNHPDLAANMWINQAEVNGDPNHDDDNNGHRDDVYGYDDFADYDSDPNDYSLHGTHVAGIIGAVGNNNLGVTGVCWTARLMSVKIFPNYDESPNQEAFMSQAIEGINYAIDNGATILNNSWGGHAYSNSLQDAIDDAREAGALFIASAGNYRFGETTLDNDADPVYPASYGCENIISVLATNSVDEIAWWSHYGPASVDIAAPGDDILSTFPTYMTPDIEGYGFSTGYETINGTSMAAPYVSGACALIWSKYPHLKAPQVKQIILDSADRLDSLQGLCVTGGRLNLYQALLHAHPLTVTIADDVADPNGYIVPGEDIVFTISYSNPSPINPNDPNYFGSADNVQIELPLPIELYCANICDPNFNIFSNAFTWDVGTLEPQESGSITVTLTVNQNTEPLGAILSKVKMLSSIGYGEATETTPVGPWGGDVIYVDALADGIAQTGAGWGNAYRDLQNALARARQGCGNEIWVARGVYVPSEGDPTVSFDMIEGVNLYGGFNATEESVNDRDFIINKTYLSGNVDVGGDDDSYVVVKTSPASLITSSTALDGFIITYSREAGIYCDDADLTIQNCVITDNDANGIYVYSSSPYILDSIISDNGTGIHDCNEADVWIEGCIISHNEDSGVLCGRNSTVSVLNSWIYGNTNGLSLDNAATGSLIRNCTIVDNSQNGIAVVQGNAPTILNCIIWNNTQGDLPGCSATYSCFDEGYQGTGNIDDDPLFAYADAAFCTYHLHTDSPCIDAGDSGSYASEYDIDGEPRVYGTLVDIGADEAYSCDASLTLDDVYNSFDFNSDGVINNREFSRLSRAWLTHDPNDPYLPTDPNDPDYISDPNTFEYYDKTQDFDSDYVVYLSDLDYLVGNWMWVACWYQNDTWVSTLGNVDADTDDMLNQQTEAGTMSLAFGSAGRLVDPAAQVEQKLSDARQMIAALQAIWLDDTDIQNHINEDAWDNFMKELYKWLNTLHAQYITQQITSQ